MTTETKSRGPIGRVRIGTPLLIGMVVAIAAPVAAAEVVYSGALDPEQTDSVPFALGGPVDKVVITGHNGQVLVRTDPSVNGIQGRATLAWHSDNAKPVPHETVLNGVATLDFGWSGISAGDASIGWEVTVPPGASVTADSKNGNLSVVGVGGALSLKTSNGNIEARELGSGGATLTTTNGNVDARFDGAPSTVKIQSVNGNVDVTTDGHTPYFDHMKTTHGQIEADNPGRDDLTLAGKQMIEVTTENGNITIR